MTVASVLYECDKFGQADVVFDPEDLDGKKHDLLILHGGEDISPFIYGESPLKTTAPAAPSRRDKLEMAITKRAWHLGIPVLAICRGAQLVCAMQGGKLYQDVKHHTGTVHDTHVKGSNIPIKSNSFHHQMMIPKNHELLGWVGPFASPRFKGYEYISEDIKEPEIVFWKDTLTLGVQGHPEWDTTVGGLYTHTRKLLVELFGE